MTTLNSPALKVQTIMGRDLAAFTDPEAAFNWVEATAPAGVAVRYVRPDGASLLHVDISRAALLAWACPDDCGQMQGA